jgi:hypothetical protein
VKEHPTRHETAVPRDGGWLPAPAVARLKRLTQRYLDGERAMDGDVQEIARSFSTAAHDAGLPPERLLIAVRSLWRDFGFGQADRLQLATLYDRLIRTAIDSYYEH